MTLSELSLPLSVRLCILYFILPVIAFAQSKKTLFFESGTTMNIPFNKQKAERFDGDTYGSNRIYTYNAAPGFYLKAGLEINRHASKRFYVTVPVSIGYKEFKTNTNANGSYYGCFYSFSGTETTKTTSSYGSVMIGPKFNFNVKRLIVYAALNMNVDLFLNSKSTLSANDESVKVIREDFKIQSVRSDDVSFNSSLQLGADYQLSSRFLVGVSVDAYFLRWNNLLNKSGSYFFKYDYSNHSTMINCGIKAGYSF